jgi:hypothetical protein
MSFYGCRLFGDSTLHDEMPECNEAARKAVVLQAPFSDLEAETFSRHFM